MVNNTDIWTYKELKSILHCTLYGNDSWHAEGFSFDSRLSCNNRIFVAINGKRYNGSDYISNAFNNGAVCAITDCQDAIGLSNNLNCIIYVTNIDNAMMQIALWIRSKVNAIYIGITGSNGKTTAKFIAYDILRTQFKVHVSKKSFNNYYGVLFTMLNMPFDTEICIIEIGTNAIGEISSLSAILQPHISAILNVGSAHIEFFGDIKATRNEKFDIAKHTSQYCIVNSSLGIQSNTTHKCKKITFGKHGNFSYISIPDIISIFYRGVRIARIKKPVIGSVMDESICASIVIASCAISIHDKQCITRCNQNPTLIQILENATLKTIEPSRNDIIRSLKNNKCNIYNSSYNANYESMAKSLESYNLSTSRFNRAAVIGEIAEIKNFINFYHVLLTKHMYLCNFMRIIFVGYGCSALYRECKTFTNCSIHKNIENTLALFDRLVLSSTSVFIKGSAMNNLSFLLKGHI